jgi:hypothetical protein
MLAHMQISAPDSAPRQSGELPAASADAVRRLRAVVDRLQSANAGDATLDALIEHCVQTLATQLDARALARLPELRGSRWSSDLGAAISLLPTDDNFSVGQRDGICWAWIQPNDDWHPGEFEARHDHPAGSGLVVAYTAALALISATIMVYARRLDHAG